MARSVRVRVLEFRGRWLEPTNLLNNFHLKLWNSLRRNGIISSLLNFAHLGRTAFIFINPSDENVNLKIIVDKYFVRTPTQ